jgi:predicted branched-subunit amino acid permease
MSAPAFDWAAFRHGLRAALCTGGLVLCGSFIGFGALIQASGLSIGHGVFMTLTMWALPGQVVLVSMMDSGAGILASALAVTLTAVRLMPMVVVLMADVRVPDRPFWLHMLVGYFTAATVWLESRRVFPAMEREERLPFLLGISIAFVPTMGGLTVVGFLIADLLPPLLSACLVFLTPTYFLLGLLASARDRIDWLSMVFGGALLLALQGAIPDIALMIAGIAGGTGAFAIARWTRGRGGHA